MTPKTITLDSSKKTNPTCIFLLTVGLILLAIYIIDSLTNILSIGESTLGIILAFTIIILGVGLILYFFGCLFNKLATIADEIEQECLEENDQQ